MRIMHNRYSLPLRRTRSIMALLLITLFAVSACKKNPNHPGYVYLPDMDESRAYETYSENDVFEDGKSLREPVEGTIPRGTEPFPYLKNEEDLLKAGQTLNNPYAATLEVLERGQTMYTRMCSHCHGHQGDGQGVLYTSGRYPYPPGNLTQEKTVNRPDGELYHIITVGYGIMSAHGAQISPDDRWRIIHYVREVIQDSTSQQ